MPRGGSPVSGIAAIGQVSVQFVTLQSWTATSRSTAHQRPLGATWPRGGTVRTARHGQGFNLGAVARGRGWRFAQLSIRRFLGLVYRVVAISPVVAAPEGGASESVGSSTSAAVRRLARPRPISKTTSAKRSHNYRND